MTMVIPGSHEVRMTHHIVDVFPVVQSDELEGCEHGPEQVIKTGVAVIRVAAHVGKTNVAIGTAPENTATTLTRSLALSPTPCISLSIPPASDMNHIASLGVCKTRDTSFPLWCCLFTKVLLLQFPAIKCRHMCMHYKKLFSSFFTKFWHFSFSPGQVPGGSLPEDG